MGWISSFAYDGRVLLGILFSVGLRDWPEGIKKLCI
jgi:hypothetical protein